MEPETLEWSMYSNQVEWVAYTSQLFTYAIMETTNHLFEVWIELPGHSNHHYLNVLADEVASLNEAKDCAQLFHNLFISRLKEPS